MTLKWLRGVCLAFPHVTETIQWADDVVFKVGGKMFAVAPAEAAASPHQAAFKCTPAAFGELTTRPGIVPAPYLARAHWVALESGHRFDAAEVKQWLATAHQIVAARLPKRTQRELFGKVLEVPQ